MATDACDEWTEARRVGLVTSILNGELTIQDACQRHALNPEQIREWVLIYRRSARDAFDDQLIQVLARQGMDASDLHAAEITGSLDDIAIADLLQTIALGRKDGVLTVSHRGQQSRVWCVRGEIVDAESGRLRAALAVYRILALEEGQLQADLRAVQRARVVHESMPALLLEAARRRDEELQLRQRLGSSESVYVPSPRASNAEMRSDPAERDVLRLCSSGSTVDQVLAGGERGDLETLQVLSRLIHQGHLVADYQLTEERRTVPTTTLRSESAPVSSLLAHVASAGPQHRRSSPRAAVLALGALCALVGSLATLLWPHAPKATRSASATAARSLEPELPLQRATLPVQDTQQDSRPAQVTIGEPHSPPRPASPEQLAPQPPNAAPPLPAAASPAAHQPLVPGGSGLAAPHPVRRSPTPSSARAAPHAIEPSPSPPTPARPEIQIIPDREPHVQVIE